MIVKLANVRLAFPALFEAQTVNGEGDPRFSAVFLIPKDSPLLKTLAEAVREVATAKWDEKAADAVKKMSALDKICLRDGDNKAEYDGFEGMHYLSASNKARPLVVDADKTPLVQADGRPYAGCYVNASVELWAQDNNYGKRINAQLRGIQFVRHGDAFGGGGGRAASEDEFDDISAGAEATADLW